MFPNNMVSLHHKEDKCVNVAVLDRHTAYFFCVHNLSDVFRGSVQGVVPMCSFSEQCSQHNSWEGCHYVVAVSWLLSCG